MLDSSCPWQSFEPASITFCEAQLCAFIQTPANTWSNLAFVIMGYFICVQAYRQHREVLASLGVICIILGMGSFVFHATGTFVGEVLDVGAMFMLVIYAICFSAWRAHRLSIKKLAGLYGALLFVSIALLLDQHWMGIAIFAALVSVCFLYEIYLKYFSEERVNRRLLLAVVGCFTLSYVIWWGDITKRWCLPNNHWLQGHALWHTLNAFSVYFLYKFYSQFFNSSEKAAP